MINQPNIELLQTLVNYIRGGASTEWGTLTLHRLLVTDFGFTAEEIKGLVQRYGFVNWFDFSNQVITKMHSKSDYIPGVEGVLRSIETSAAKQLVHQ